MTSPPSPSHPSAANPSQTLRAVVVGTGKISEEHLRFLSNSSIVQLAGVCDLSPSLAKYAANRFKAENAFTDYGTMLRNTKPHVVHVLTPAATHARFATEALNAGAHVIVEKPVALNHNEFETLWALARSHNLRLIEDHNYRFNGPVRAVQALVNSGRIGVVRDIEVRMGLAILDEKSRYADTILPHPSHQLPAGVIHEFITHLAYLTLQFLPVVDRVWANWARHSDNPLFTFDDLDGTVIGQGVHGRIRFSAHTGPDCFELTVRGSKGWVSTDLFQPHLRAVLPRGAGPFNPLANQFLNGWSLIGSSLVGFKNKVMQKTPYEGLHRFLGLTYQALLDGTEPPVTHDDMERAIQLVDRLLEDRGRA
jgi:predicted dehydrogenase